MQKFGDRVVVDSGSLHKHGLCVLIQAVFGLICGEIEMNIQGIKPGVQPKHVLKICLIASDTWVWTLQFLSVS